MAGIVFRELYLVQVYKIVASTVICEVWHRPRYFIVQCTGSCLFPSVPDCVCVSQFVVFCGFRNRRNILSERFLSLDLT